MSCSFFFNLHGPKPLLDEVRDFLGTGIQTTDYSQWIAYELWPNRLFSEFEEHDRLRLFTPTSDMSTRPLWHEFSLGMFLFSEDEDQLCRNALRAIDDPISDDEVYDNLPARMRDWLHLYHSVNPHLLRQPCLRLIGQSEECAPVCLVARLTKRYSGLYGEVGGTDDHDYFECLSVFNGAYKTLSKGVYGGGSGRTIWHVYETMEF